MSAYCPARGDIVWIDFTPRVGHEQSGKRPGIVLSPLAYNKAVGLMLCCPITSKEKGYPFEVRIPEGHQISGVVLSDHVRSLDWKTRHATFISRAPRELTEDVLDKLQALLV
ncbi:MAG: endoribonuclease MazF [Ignavibacteriales bacterium]|nr:endoribonuclease MazF [Ignavibacteriales bacterium]